MYYDCDNYYVYFMSNKNNSVLYIGVTSDLVKRVYQHKTKIFGGFTAKYCCNKLIYYESYNSVFSAINREKQLKSGSRKRKDDLVSNFNPDWKDLSEDWLFSFT